MLQHNEPTSPLLSLPPELKAPIFVNLEGTDLAMLRMVCRHLAAFIPEVPELQYKIELAMSGMVNGPPDGPPVMERRQNLRKYREALEVGALPIKTISIPHGHRWRSTAGVVVFFFPSGSTLVIHRLASTFSGIAEKTWTIAPACLRTPADQIHFELDLIAVDVSQDLVILTKITGNKAEGHVLSLSHNGAPHALAVSSVIDITLGASRESDMEIEGDLVRWQFRRHDQSHNGLEVWNWKIGRVVWRHDSEDEHPGLHPLRCHILDPSHILAIDSTSLIVYDIAHTGQTPLSTKGRALLRLQLPSTADGISLHIPDSKLQRSHSSTDGGHSFHGDPSLAVIALHGWLHYSEGSGVTGLGSLVVHVPLTTIHRFLRRICSPLPPTAHEGPSPVILTWDAWGPSGARAFFLHRWTHISTMGSQCVIVFSENHRNVPGVFVVDVCARAPDPTDKSFDDLVDLDVGECLEYPELFRSAVHTTLPYRWLRKPGPVRPDGDIGRVYLLQEMVLHLHH